MKVYLLLSSKGKKVGHFLFQEFLKRGRRDSLHPSLLGRGEKGVHHNTTYSNPSFSAHEAFQKKCALTRKRTNRDTIYVVKGTKCLLIRTIWDFITVVKGPQSMKKMRTNWNIRNQDFEIFENHEENRTFGFFSVCNENIISFVFQFTHCFPFDVRETYAKMV